MHVCAYECVLVCVYMCLCVCVFVRAHAFQVHTCGHKKANLNSQFFPFAVGSGIDLRLQGLHSKWFYQLSLLSDSMSHFHGDSTPSDKLQWGTWYLPSSSFHLPPCLTSSHEGIATLSQDLHEVVGKISASQVQTHDGMRQGIALVDRHVVSHTVSRVQHNTWGTIKHAVRHRHHGSWCSVTFCSFTWRLRGVVRMCSMW